MLDRKAFLKNSAALAMGGLLLPGASYPFFKRVPDRNIGIQLFTFFNVIDSDVRGTLKKIAGVGYKEIESAFSKKGGYYGMNAKDFSAMLKDLGMSWKSHHVLGAPFKLPPNTKVPTGADGKPISFPPMKNLKENHQELVDQAAESGVPYLVCASIPTGTMEEVKEAISVLNKSAEACKKAGIRFAYHNHDAEFKNVEGEVPYHLILAETDADTLKMELDLCWVTKAGDDPVELFKKNPGRFELWHVKDLDKGMTGPQPVGTGIIDFKRIFANAEVAGMKHFFVEHDMPDDPMTSVTTSFNNLTKILQS